MAELQLLLQLLTDEIAGLSGAIQALKKVPTPASGNAPAEFVQLASTNVLVVQRVDQSLSYAVTK